MITRMLAVCLAICAIPVAAVAQQEARAQTVYVQVRYRELVVNPSVLRPGPITLLVDNLTLIQEPVVLIRAKGQAASSGRTRLAVPEKRRSRKRWLSAVLTPGDYTVILEQLPDVQASITVKAPDQGGSNQ